MEPGAVQVKAGHRYYSPDLGRWTQPDPSGLEANPYAYVNCNPTNSIDPSGLDGFPFGLGLQNCAAFGLYGGVLGGWVGFVGGCLFGYALTYGMYWTYEQGW